MAVFGKAQYIKRVEDDRLLTGSGGFTDNLARPNQAHVVLVRSPHAHARIEGPNRCPVVRLAAKVEIRHEQITDIGRFLDSAGAEVIDIDNAEINMASANTTCATSCATERLTAT